MQYDGAARLVKVAAIEAGQAAARAPVVGRDVEEGMVFEDRPLQEVLDKLAKRYQVSITYSSEELKGLHFSGKVLHNDSLPVLLQIIGRMNDLSVASVPDGFSIRKVRDQ